MHSALFIHLVSYSLEMLRIHTSAITTQMIEFQSFGNGSNEVFIGESMRQDLAIRMNVEDAISI